MRTHFVAALSALSFSLLTTALSAQTFSNEGLSVRVSQPIAVKPQVMRVLLPFKAEEGINEKAIERLAAHMKTIKAACVEMDAVPDSVEFSNPESHPVNLIQNMTQMGVEGANVWMGNGMQNAVFAVQAQPAMPVAGFELPPMAFDFPIAPKAPREQTKQPPTLFAATSVVAADWNIEGKSGVEIALLKSKLASEIAKRNLDGKELFHKFTSEQEDEIFELTKIDIRNGDTRNMFVSKVAAPKFVFVGSIPEQEYNEALKKAFQTASKQAKQMATAGNLALGKMYFVNVQMESKANSNADTPAAFNQAVSVTYPAYPQSSESVSRIDWEPSIASGSFRSDTLNQLSKELILNAKFKIE